MSTWINRCHFGDCRDTMRRMIADGVRVQCIVTSPPYWGLRDYGVDGQIGLEPTLSEFLAQLVEVFDLCRQLLADDGTLWLNMGDSYASNAGGYDATGSRGATSNPSISAGTMAAVVKNRRRVPASGLKPKDLIGQPWRLAFALQQPSEHVHIKDVADRAWLAALVDGEGCLTIMRAENGAGTADSYPPVMQVKMCDPECIEHANNITGFNQNLHQSSPSTRGNRDTYQWRITSRRAADIVAEIYPYLRIKRKQAVVIWNHQLVRDSYETKRGVPMPDAAREKQKQCRDLIQRLNRREPVDIPDWMVEPKIHVEPGWYLRQDVIWHKPNPMPESVRDRCTKSHEYLFLMTRSDRYYFDQDAILEPASPNTLARLAQDVANQTGSARANGGAKTNGNMKPVGRGSTGVGFGHGYDATPKPRSRRDSFKREDSKREQAIPGQAVGTHRPDRAESEWDVSRRNRRSVWTIPTQAYRGAHFATFPEALVEPCVLAGSRPGDIVFDPFFGTGTVGRVALRLGRQFIGCELNFNNAALQDDRLRGVTAGLPLEVCA